MSRRTEKIARSIQVHLAELINYHLNDPRVEGMVTITTVEVSPDLSRARVGLTELNADDARMRTLLRALLHASGRLRTMLTERLEMRVVPHLDFFTDVKAIRTRETLEAIARAMQNTRPAEVEAETPGHGDAGTEEEDTETRKREDAETEGQENPQP